MVAASAFSIASSFRLGDGAPLTEMVMSSRPLTTTSRLPGTSRKAASPRPASVGLGVVVGICQ